MFDLRGLADALARRGCRPGVHPATELRRLEKRENMTLETRFGGLDVIQRAPAVPSFTTNAAAAGRAQDLADLANLPAG